MLRYAAAAATALMLLIGVSACGSQDPPVAKPPPTRTATSPAPSPSPTPPALPAAAKANTKAGAKAFVRHFVAVLNFAGTHGNTSEFRRLYTPRCSNCRALADGIDGVYQRGGSISGGGWSIDHFRYYGESGGEVYLDAFVDSKPQVMRRSAHAKVRHFQGAQGRLRAFVLVRKDSEWLVSGLDRRI